MATRRRVSGRYKSAHQIHGYWTWVDSHGELRSYLGLNRLIAQAAQEGWHFDHRVGTIGLFCGQ